MKKSGRKKISEKKFLIKHIQQKQKKRRRIKLNKTKKKYSKNISFYIFIFIGFFIVCYLLYLLKKKLSPKNIFNDINIGLLKPYIEDQINFCKYYEQYKNQKYEEQIVLYNVTFGDLKYKMYIYNISNFILGEFMSRGTFEKELGDNMIEALKFYANKNNIKNNKDIIMLDIGGNIGWYPSLLGRYGYTILSFEAFEKNNYIAKKNYCLLNKDSNVIIITKGLGTEEKTCFYFNQRGNGGNGMVLCDEKSKYNNVGGFIKENKVEMTTLNTFMPYLSNKNIALMKLDVEGYELKVLEGGKELITKYHVPFIVLEFTPAFGRYVGYNSRDLAQFFVDNGYKISLKGFLSKEYITVNELLARAGFQVNSYFIHESILNLLN